MAASMERSSPVGRSPADNPNIVSAEQPRFALLNLQVTLREATSENARDARLKLADAIAAKTVSRSGRKKTRRMAGPFAVRRGSRRDAQTADEVAVQAVFLEPVSPAAFLVNREKRAYFANFSARRRK